MCFKRAVRSLLLMSLTGANSPSRGDVVMLGERESNQAADRIRLRTWLPLNASSKLMTSVGWPERVQC
jgi:hypothetical protein